MTELRCSERLRLDHKPYPKTCEICKLGPCQKITERPPDAPYANEVTFNAPYDDKTKPENQGVIHPEIMRRPRYAGLVQRFHAWPMVKPQTVAEHTWQVWIIYYQLWGQPSADVSTYIMLHDVGELWTGDLGTHVKQSYPEVREFMEAAEEDGLKEMQLIIPEIDPNEIWRVKACDLLEGLEHATLDLCMGNRVAALVQKTYIRGLRSHLNRTNFESEDRNIVTSRVKEILDFGSLLMAERGLQPYRIYFL